MRGGEPIMGRGAGTKKYRAHADSRFVHVAKCLLRVLASSPLAKSTPGRIQQASTLPTPLPNARAGVKGTELSWPAPKFCGRAESCEAGTKVLWPCRKFWSRHKVLAVPKVLLASLKVSRTSGSVAVLGRFFVRTIRLFGVLWVGGEKPGSNLGFDVW